MRESIWGAQSPYRRSTALIRVHLASTLLVVPQFAVSVFTLTYLVEQRHWDKAEPREHFRCRRAEDLAEGEGKY